MPSGLELLPDGAFSDVVLANLHPKDLASLSASSRTLHELMGRQPEAVWKAAAENDPAYTRHAL